MSVSSKNIEKYNVRKTRSALSVVAVLMALAISVYFTLVVFCYFMTYYSKGSISFLQQTRVIFFNRISFSVKLPLVKEAVNFIFTQPYDILFELLNYSLIPLGCGAACFLILTLLFGRLIRFDINRRSTLHGSSNWLTEKEMKKSGHLHKNGVVLGQTYDAKFIRKKAKKPRKKDFKGNMDEYYMKLNQYDPYDFDVLTKKNGKAITAAFSSKQNAHLLVVGATRSGKGVSICIPTNFYWMESIIMLDPKAESWYKCANFRSRFSYTFKFDPADKDTVHYNFLWSVRRGENCISDLQNMSYTLIEHNERATDQYWDDNARQLFACVAGYTLYCEPVELKNLTRVYTVMSPTLDGSSIDDEACMPEEVRQANYKLSSADLSDGDRAHLQEIVDNWRKEQLNLTEIQKTLRSFIEKIKILRQVTPCSEDEHQRFLNRFRLSAIERLKVEKEFENKIFADDLPALASIQSNLSNYATMESKQLMSVVSTMLSKLHVLADPNVQKAIDRSDFVFEDFVDGVLDASGKRRPVSLYICPELRDMHRLMPLIRLFFEQAVNILSGQLFFEKPINGKPMRKRTFRLLMLMDEFFQLGKMEVVERALSLSAGYGILFLMIVQSYKQLQQLYGEEDHISGHCAYQIVLRVNSRQSAEDIEKLLGQGTYQRTTIQSSGRIFDITHLQESENISEMGRSLLKSDEIRTMPDDECLIFISGKHPYLAKKIRYYNDKRFIKYFLDPKTNKDYPVPLLKDNYPHPEGIDLNGNFVGYDREGWQTIRGFSDNQAQVTDEYDDPQVEQSEKPVENPEEIVPDDEVISEDVSKTDEQLEEENQKEIYEENPPENEVTEEEQDGQKNEYGSEIEIQELDNNSYAHEIGKGLIGDN